MIRIVLFLIVVGALSLGVAWLADRPGDVVIVWQGLRIETSLLVLGAGLVAALVVLVLLWSLIRAILRSPGLLSRHLQHRRGVRAYEAISNGLIAVGAGDIAAAQKHAAAVNRLTPAEPLGAVVERPIGAALQATARAPNAPSAPWQAAPTPSRSACMACSSKRIAATIPRAREPMPKKPRAPRRRSAGPAAPCWKRAARTAIGPARWLCSRPMRGRSPATFIAGNARCCSPRMPGLGRHRSRPRQGLALEAQKLAPTFVPAASLAARLLAEGGQQRKASRIIDKAWRANPHPELAQTYSELRSGKSAATSSNASKRWRQSARPYRRRAGDRARRARRAGIRQGARRARTRISPRRPSAIALLMAELERVERNDIGRAREWLARAVHAAARSGLDRRRPCLRALAAGLAGDRTARRARMARAGDRDDELTGD